MFTLWEILTFSTSFELQNFYPWGEIFEFDNKYIIRCFVLKYRLIFLLVKYSQDTYQLVFQKRAPNNI